MLYDVVDWMMTTSFEAEEIDLRISVLSSFHCYSQVLTLDVYSGPSNDRRHSHEISPRDDQNDHEIMGNSETSHVRSFTLTVTVSHADSGTYSRWQPRQIALLTLSPQILDKYRPDWEKLVPGCEIVEPYRAVTPLLFTSPFTFQVTFSHITLSCDFSCYLVILTCLSFKLDHRLLTPCALAFAIAEGERIEALRFIEKESQLEPEALGSGNLFDDSQARDFLNGLKNTPPDEYPTFVRRAWSLERLLL